MDFEVLKYLSTLGVGGILAGIMFVYNNRQAKENAERWRGQSEAFAQVVKENTAAITKLTTLIDRDHR